MGYAVIISKERRIARISCGGFQVVRGSRIVCFWLTGGKMLGDCTGRNLNNERENDTMKSK